MIGNGFKTSLPAIKTVGGGTPIIGLPYQFPVLQAITTPDQLTYATSHELLEIQRYDFTIKPTQSLVSIQAVNKVDDPNVLAILTPLSAV